MNNHPGQLSYLPLNEQPRTGWVDLLRVIACFMVVFSHCCDGFVGAFDSDYSAFLTGSALGSLMRPSVPLFVMMTGVLLLPLGAKYNTVDSFYRKRLGRIIPPLIFWSVMLPILFFLFFGYVVTQPANPMVNPDNYTMGTLVKRIWTMIFNFNFDTVPLWYLYMLAGLYIIMPIINAWLVQASKKDIELVLKIWGITLILPYIKLLAPQWGYEGVFGNYDILGGCDWNVYNTFYYISGFIGYLILAYYLTRYPLQWSMRKTLAISIPMFVVGYAITEGGYILTQKYHPGDYAFLEIVWYFTGINVFMMTFAIFVIVSKIKIAEIKWLKDLAGLTFGIYLCHFIFIFATYELFANPTLPNVVRICCMALTTFAAAALVTKLLTLNRYTSKLVR